MVPPCVFKDTHQRKPKPKTRKQQQSDCALMRLVIMPRVLKYCEIHLLKEKLLSYVENIVHEIMFCMFWIA